MANFLFVYRGGKMPGTPGEGERVMDREDLEVVKRWVTEAQARWGVDAGHRREFGLEDSSENTILFGLRRMLLGYALLWTLNSFNVLGPLLASVYGDFLSGFGLSDQIFASLSAEYLLYAAITVALAGILAALAPAQRIRNLNPSEAMRSE